jgi:hypothetical protein
LPFASAPDRDHAGLQIDVVPVGAERLFHPHARADAEDRGRPEDVTWGAQPDVQHVGTM